MKPKVFATWDDADRLMLHLSCVCVLDDDSPFTVHHMNSRNSACLPS